MRTLAVINQKGGVGKTTSAVNLAAALVRAGQRVLLLDLDPQAHASLHVGVELGPGEVSVYDVLVHGASLYETLRSVGERLSIIPAHVDLVAAEIELAARPERERALQRALSPLREHYDWLIVDCAPSLGLLSVNALAAVREIVIPLQPHFLALQGLGKLLETVSLVRASVNPDLRVLGVLLCMYERGTKLGQEVQNDVRAFLAAAPADAAWAGARLFATGVRRNVKLAECPSFGRTIFDYAPTSHGAEDYAGVAAELMAIPAIASGEVIAAATRAEEAGLSAAALDPLPAPILNERDAAPSPPGV